MGRSTKGIDYQNVPRPVAALSDEYPAGYVDPRHCHQRGQLLYAVAGVTLVVTDDASYIVPPQRALWVPAGVWHEVQCRNAVSVRTIYVDAASCVKMPTVCRVIEVSSLLRELVVEAANLPVEYDETGRDGRIMTLILDEIASMTATPLHVPMPQNQKLLQVCLAILGDPAQNDTLDDWAESTCMGRRTFTRLFRKETGMSFAAWRQHVRLLEAMSRLATGHRVTSVAFDVGYNSSSAFTAMFRRTFGAAPTHYFTQDPAEVLTPDPVEG
ncbi:AraC family transcriptional regulator [Govanella unica]|uniref:Helix-turn-helix transcriptional regulator n=1 Tax=Govanella unica TaxID=2975056 RepID=A0A9X3TXV3_9PROT|nr:helix-turn-helix transcriptional regulator [Govania unica]MDA5193986.1 helix-turn-helix transcriptional regulator [Govania unica]